jgi:GTPase
VRRLRWKGPVYRISGLARQGTEALCRDIMKRLEELGYQDAEAESESG